MLNFNLNPNQTETFHAAAVDANFNPGLLWGGAVPVWTPAPNVGLTLTPSADGFSCDIKANASGIFTITVSSADPTGAPVSTQFTVTVPEQPATQFVITADPPRP